MKDFAYYRYEHLDEALAALAEGARPIAGGTNLVDLMREGIEQPSTLVDVAGLALDSVVEGEGEGEWVVGSGVTNTQLASHRALRRELPVVAEAIMSGATGQIRNMATVGGNLMQRSRCSYFYDLAAPCNKRRPGAGCAARDGYARGTAIFGTSDHCVATHPSDLCVALVALDAEVQLRSVHDARDVALESFHLEPQDTPHHESVLRADELITAVRIPALGPGYRSTYRKVRDRSSYAFALVSVAAALRIEDGTVVDARLALGGVGTRPWRAHLAEAALRGLPASRDSFRAAARAELVAARPLPDTEFKIGLTERTLVAVLRDLAGSDLAEGNTNGGGGSR